MDTSVMPTEVKTIPMDPELFGAIENILKPMEGEKLEKAKVAVTRVYHSTVTGSYDEILEAYEAAIAEAVGEKAEE